MSVTFSTIITDSATSYARETIKNPGWHLIPKRWAISATAGDLDSSRTYDDMLTTWITQPFSSVYSTGTDKLAHSVVIPPRAASSNNKIGEIYFIYQDYYGNEFLFAIAQPDSEIYFIQGTGQSYLFVFTLKNCQIADTFEINYTYPQEIEDHNQSSTAHAELFANLVNLDVSYDASNELLIFTKVKGGSST